MMKTKTLLHTLLTTWLLPVAALAEGALPTGPKVVAGDITISVPSSTQMEMQQSFGAAIVDWGSFSIGTGNGVRINNGAGATLNRVTGNDLSSILGSLQATGSVYLINPNGIVFGATGVVDTGGTFVASTLDIANGDFLDGGDDVFAGSSDAFVINLGRISSLGGDVALMGRHVVNDGAIAAPVGTVGLVAGREILMRDASVADGMFSVRIGGADSSVSDSGAIRAAAAELRANGGNVYALAGNTDGVIAATGVAKVKGRVFLTAGDGGKVKVDKPVKATEADGKGGTITVNGGTVEMAGVLDASGRAGGQVWINSAVQTVFSGQVLAFGDGTEGSGGFAEVSGRHLSFGGVVDTGGGTVLIDPEDIEITDFSGVLSGASIVSAAGLERLLSTQNVIITTDAGTGSGTIVVSGPVRWSRRFSLSLLAQGDIWFLEDVQGTNPNRGNLNIVAGWDGTTAGTAFDAAPFLTADLATTSVFGNANGLDYTLIGASSSDTRQASGSAFISGANVGVLAGNTSLFAGQVEVGAAFSPSQLGFNITNHRGPGPSGDIVVRSTGHVGVLAGTSVDAAAQIGHIGMDFSDSSAATIDASGNILIEAATSVDLGGGNGSASHIYAMIGHGSRDFTRGMQASGDRSGTITILAAQDVSIDNGDSGFSSEAWIGHASADGVISGADIKVTALSFDQDYAAPVVSGVKGVLDIGMLSQNTAGGNVTYVATDNSAGGGLTLTGRTGGGFCECDSVTTTGDMIVQSAADIVLDSGFAFSNDGGGDVALAAGAKFTNGAGASAFGAMVGRWLVYSIRPDINTGDIGTLEAAFLSYNTAFDPADPFGVGLSGNGLIYAVRPVVTIADASTIYSGALTAPKVNLTVGGVEVVAADFGLSLGTSFVDSSQVVLSGTGYINAGVYATALDATATALPALGVSVAGLAKDFGQLTVDRALLTASITGEPTKVYDGTNAATLTSGNYLLSGFALGEGATVTQTVGTYASANASATNAVTAALTAANFAATGSTLLANYVLPATLTGGGAIDRRVVTVSLATVPTKPFDGNTNATLSATDFLLTGFVAGEGASVLQSNGTYATVRPGAGNVVTLALTESDFVADTGTLLSNYDLPSSATGEGFIEPSPTLPPRIPPQVGLKLFETTPLGEPAGPALGLELISTETTQRIMDEIKAGSNFCKALVKQEFAIDCLSDRLQSVADGLSATGEYSEVRAALQDAAQKLHALALKNASQDLAATIARAAGQQSSRALTAISTAALGAANAEAAAIIDGARLVLLRSSSGSERRAEAFTQVAQVVNSTKVLLRSS